VTGKVVEGERERCIAAGASAFIAKPVDTAALHDGDPPVAASG
jgi:CheY-like chemotaxis protein